MMHGMIIFFHREIVNALNRIQWKSKRGLKIKEVLDRRLALVCLSGTLRDEKTRRSIRMQKSCFSEVDMSATDRMNSLFLLPHVLGHQGRMVPDNVRGALLTAIAHAQLMLIAASGQRQYTRSEFQRIYDDGYQEMFAALEHINAIYEQRRYQTRLEKHTSKPLSLIHI